MKFPLIVCVFLLTVSRSQSEDITARGTERDRVSINCPYPEGYENSYKYFYRGPYGERVVILESDGKSSVSSGRFSLQDNPQTRSFTVSISDLKMDDAGLYGCRAGWPVGHYLDVHLEVLRAPQTVTGFRGERVDIRCSYESGYETNSKYFCKGLCNIGNKIIMVKSGSPAKDERFSLTDDTTARVFTVTITDLRTEDQGQYWCAVERSIITDVYSKIALLVKDDEITEVSTISSFSVSSEHPSTSQHPSHPSSQQQVKGSFVIIVTAEALVLLLIAVPLIIVAVRKKKKNKGLMSSSTVVFIPVIYDQIKDTGLFCNPEDRDTESTVFYSGVS